MTHFYVQTMPGIEPIAWLEIRDRLPGAAFGQYLFAKEQNGIVTFDYPGPFEPLQQLRTTEDVFVQALFRPKLGRTRRDLAQVGELVSKGEEFGRAVNEFLRDRKFSGPPTYRVISRKYGSHDYRRKDFEQAVARGLQQRYPRWTAVPDGGQVEVWANLLGSQLLIGLRLTDRQMRHRHKKRVELPASLRPSVAAAMVYLSQPERDDRFVDPMCGSGTILLERRQAGPLRLLLGGDLDAERATAARLNVLGRRRRGPATIMQWDATRLPLTAGAVDKLVCNLPFGQQIKVDPARLYPALFAEMARVLAVNGRAVILSSEYDQVKESVRRQPTLHIQTGYSMAILGRWGRIYLIQKQ